LADGKLPNAMEDAHDAAPGAAIGPHLGAVFISYASQDSEAAVRICDALRSARIEVWFDQSELRGGDAWDQTIRSRIRDCTLFVPIISRHTQERLEGYFRREWKLAVDRTNDMAEEKAFLVPVVVDDTKPQDAAVPAQFRGLQWTVMVGGYASTSFVERIADLLSAQEGKSKRSTAGPKGGHSVGRAGKDDLKHSTSRGVGHWLNRSIIAVLFVALVCVAADRFWLSNKSAPKQTADTAIGDAKKPTEPPVIAKKVPDRSIVVLPFLDISEKHDQEYFADGLTEELIDRLAQSPDLKVIARTSSFHYKGRNDDVREIASALGVSHLLEGSVRKSGKHLRVTVQLVKASDGSHLWSESYDQLAQDIFAVQQDIATTVTRRLNASMSAIGQGDRARPTNFAAYELLLQGDAHRAYNLKDVNAGIDCYRRAIALDAAYSLAWARLAGTLSVKRQLVGFKEQAALTSEAQRAAKHAIELDPNSAFAYYSLGWSHNVRGEAAAAEEAYRHANLLQPRIADRLLANIDLARTGNLSAAIDVYRNLLEHDPKYSTLYSILGEALFNAGRYEESEATVRQLIALEPEFSGARSLLIRTLVFKGAAVEALSEMANEDAANLPLDQVLIFWALGRREESTLALRSIKREPGSLADIARLRVFRGEIDQAFRDLNEAADAGEDLTDLTYGKEYQPLRSDPRFSELVRKASQL
jgi:TolB-like protein